MFCLYLFDKTKIVFNCGFKYNNFKMKDPFCCLSFSICACVMCLLISMRNYKIICWCNVLRVEN